MKESAPLDIVNRSLISMPSTLSKAKVKSSVTKATVVVVCQKKLPPGGRWVGAGGSVAVGATDGAAVGVTVGTGVGAAVGANLHVLSLVGVGASS